MDTCWSERRGAARLPPVVVASARLLARLLADVTRTRKTHLMCGMIPRQQTYLRGRLNTRIVSIQVV